MGEVSPPAFTGRWLIQCDIPSEPHVTGPGAALDLGHVPGNPSRRPGIRDDRRSARIPARLAVPGARKLASGLTCSESR